MTFAPEDQTQDLFLGGRLRLSQPRRGYRAAADPVLLAAACPARTGQSVLELGCGVGVASLCLGTRVAGLRLSGLELQPEYAELARHNACVSGISLEVHEGDLRDMPPALRIPFDHVIANPPYFAPQDGTAARDPGRETAQREATPLADWLAAARRRLQPGGWLTLIQLADRLPDLLAGMEGFGAVSVLPLAPRPGRPANRVILRARKGARGPFRLLAPLILHDGPAHDGDRENYSPAARAVLRDGAALAGFD
ncbi:MAG: tRNA1(Val) (adenine(37)-N6)-methyltransferase [Gemmobacter sp.]|uniref:tRNA1(Val) (adenine(37)-N6)-methyltransferase n=1 Tax=Gemmobacter sp. TaxID=1898957 RepID=UPI00391BC9DC